jgi:Ca2+-binding EF-hand superfamily protein
MKNIALSLACVSGLAWGWNAHAADAEPQPVQLFDSLDANHDGSLTADEIAEDRQKFFDRLVKAGDKNADGALTKDEFVAASNDKEKPVAPPGDPVGGARPMPSPEQIFKRLDKNSDGKLEKIELPADMPQPRRERLMSVFEKAGKDELTRDQFVAAMPARPGMKLANSSSPAKKGTAKGKGKGQGRPVTAEVLTRWDKNGDRMISRDELPEPARARMGKIFDRLGKDELSIDQLVKAAERREQAKADAKAKEPSDADEPADDDEERPRQRERRSPRPPEARTDGPRSGDERVAGPRREERRPDGRQAENHPRPDGARPQGPRGGERNPHEDMHERAHADAHSQAHARAHGQAHRGPGHVAPEGGEHHRPQGMAFTRHRAGHFSAGHHRVHGGSHFQGHRLAMSSRPGFSGHHHGLGALDRDHDGKVSRHELLAAVRHFDGIDLNGDGQLELAELIGIPHFGTSGGFHHGQHSGWSSRFAHSEHRGDQSGRHHEFAGSRMRHHGPAHQMASHHADHHGMTDGDHHEHGEHIHHHHHHWVHHVSWSHDREQGESRERHAPREHAAPADHEHEDRGERREFRREGFGGMMHARPQDGDRPRDDGARREDRPRPEDRPQREDGDRREGRDGGREPRRPGFTGFGGFSREGGFTGALQSFSRGRERAEGETANRPADAGPRAGGMLFNPGRRRGGFAGLDKNQDGGVDREEAPEPMRDRFDHLDLDHDGKVTSSEFFRAIADEYGLNQRTEQE